MLGSFNCASMNIDNANIVLKTAIKSRINGLNVGHINAQSIMRKGKLDEFKYIIHDVPLDIICVSETWLQPLHNDSEAGIIGYTLIRNDRTFNSHGGVCIYVRNELPFSVVGKSNDTHTESLFLQVTLGESKILIGAFYRPPNVHGISDIENALNVLHQLYSDIILIGDFNINVLKANSLSNSFKDFLDSINLFISNVEPTHFTDTSATQIDLIISSKPHKMIRVNQVSVPGISKHDLIFCCYEMSIDRNNNELPTLYRSFKDINCSELIADVQRSNWSLVYDLSDVDDQIHYFNECIGHLYMTHVPLRESRTTGNNYPAWFNTNVKTALFERDLSYRHWKLTKTNESKLIFNKLRNIANRVCRDAKRSYFNHLFPPNSSQKTIWKNLSVLGVVDRTITTHNFKPDEINEQFTLAQSVISNIVFSDPVSHYNHSLLNTLDELSFRGVATEEVYYAISCIKSNAMGLDGVCPKFLNLILPGIIQVITHIFNNILTTSVFPSDWKKAKVIPIPKKTKIETVDDLRPISILPFLSKVLEKLIELQISKFIEANKLLNPHQSGFRKSHSTSTALLKVHSDLLRQLDNKKACVLVLLDFSKAFDTVPHILLLHKLRHNFNFSELAVKLISSYLLNRSQVVYCNKLFSESRVLNSGVPQGSILGPLLFSLFVNDLPMVLTNSVHHLYADDFQIYEVADPRNINTCVNNINQDLKYIAMWSKSNGIQLNNSKTQAMLIYRKGTFLTAPPVLVDNIVCPYVDKIKNLGIIFDKHLAWDSDVNRISSNSYAVLRPLWKFSDCLPKNIRHNLVMSLILPHFTYCCVVRSKLPIYNERKLEKVFNSCIRFIYGLRKFDRLTPYRNNILGYSLNKYINIQILIFLYKIITTQLPDYLYSEIVFAKSTRTLNLIVPKFSFDFYKSCFFVHAITLWNTLNPDVKRCKTVNLFRRACENFM